MARRGVLKNLSSLHWLYSVLYLLLFLIVLDVAAVFVAVLISAHAWDTIHYYVIGALWVFCAAMMSIMLYLHLLEDRHMFQGKKSSE